MGDESRQTIAFFVSTLRDVEEELATVRKRGQMKLRGTKAPREDVRGDAILLAWEDLANHGGVMQFIIGVAHDVHVKAGETDVHVGDVVRFEIPIAVGGPGGMNLRPDVIPIRGWSPAEWIYLPADRVVRIEAEEAALEIHGRAVGSSSGE